MGRVKGWVRRWVEIKKGEGGVKGVDNEGGKGGERERGWIKG